MSELPRPEDIAAFVTSVTGEPFRTDEDEVRRFWPISTETSRCIVPGCVATWEHYHGGFPGGHDNPDDPDGPPIPFTRPNPEANVVRDYDGRPLE